jgi:hypothetical protein
MNPDVMLTIAFVGEAVLVAIVGLALVHAQRHPAPDEMGQPPDGGLAASRETIVPDVHTVRSLEKGTHNGHV